MVLYTSHLIVMCMGLTYSILICKSYTKRGRLHMMAFFNVIVAHH